MALNAKYAGCVVEFFANIFTDALIGQLPSQMPPYAQNLCTRHADQLQNLSHKVSMLVSKGQNATMDIASVKRNL